MIIIGFNLRQQDFILWHDFQVPPNIYAIFVNPFLIYWPLYFKDNESILTFPWIFILSDKQNIFQTEANSAKANSEATMGWNACSIPAGSDTFLPTYLFRATNESIFHVRLTQCRSSVLNCTPVCISGWNSLRTDFATPRQSALWRFWKLRQNRTLKRDLISISLNDSGKKPIH